MKKKKSLCVNLLRTRSDPHRPSSLHPYNPFMPSLVELRKHQYNITSVNVRSSPTCSCLDQLVSVLVLLLQFHFLSSELGLEVIHLSEDEKHGPRGQVGMTGDRGNGLELLFTVQDRNSLPIEILHFLWTWTQTLLYLKFKPVCRAFSQQAAVTLLHTL